MALDRGSLLALTFCGGLFIEFARTEFGQQAGLFDGALKAAQGDFEGFVLFNADSRHSTPSCDDPEMYENLELRLVPGQDAAKSKHEFSHVWTGDSTL